jgi:uncharacterized protein with HEPN domain
MKIPDRIRIEHISEAISEIESYVKGISEDDFVRNSLIRSATVRQFEVIGEAVKAISEELQGQYSEIPWRVWADFRNVLIHQYFGVDYAEVYKTIQNDMPNFKSQIEEILSETIGESKE